MIRLNTRSDCGGPLLHPTQSKQTANFCLKLLYLGVVGVATRGAGALHVEEGGRGGHVGNHVGNRLLQRIRVFRLSLHPLLHLHRILQSLQYQYVSRGKPSVASTVWRGSRIQRLRDLLWAPLIWSKNCKQFFH